MRAFSGKILLRVPSEVHRDLAREAFESGRSISELCMEAILARKALKRYDPWRSIERLWGRRREARPARLTAEIRETIRDVRRAR